MNITTEAVGSRSVRVWSGGEGAPLLYLHGFEQHPGDASFLKRLAERFEVRAPEHPGYGHSSGLDSIRDMLDMTLHLRRFVEQWGRGPVNVVGHSLGGMFAAELAAIAPHLVRKLVLVDAYGLWLDDEPLPDPFVLMPDALAALKWHDAGRAGDEPSAYDPAIDRAAQEFRATNLAAATKFLWPIPDRGLGRRLGYIACPTLVLHGESDGLLPLGHATALARGIPGADLVRIKAAGHLPMVEAEDAFLDAVGSFLT
jgi:pimeloyl-ACP methyl ester carboxylesterase